MQMHTFAYIFQNGKCTYDHNDNVPNLSMTKEDNEKISEICHKRYCILSSVAVSSNDTSSTVAPRPQRSITKN